MSIRKFFTTVRRLGSSLLSELQSPLRGLWHFRAMLILHGSLRIIHERRKTKPRTLSLSLSLSSSLNSLFFFLLLLNKTLIWLVAIYKSMKIQSQLSKECVSDNNNKARKAKCVYKWKSQERKSEKSHPFSELDGWWLYGSWRAGCKTRKRKRECWRFVRVWHISTHP